MPGKNILLIALYALSGLILGGLIAVEFSQSRYDACVSIGAFSKSQCEEYAQE